MNFKSFCQVVLAVSLLSLFCGCGYKPTSYYAKEQINGTVYIESSIDMENSDNSILIKDIMHELIISQFNSKIVYKKEDADINIKVKLNSVSHIGLETSDDGYTKLYRTIVSISVRYKDKRKNSNEIVITVSNYYDYTVDNDSVVTNEKKLEAVRLASSKAMSDIFSKIAIRSFKK